MVSRTGSQWDHKSDKDLLLTIIDTGALKGIDWKSIAERMATKGYTFTHEACRQHFQKIRKESRSESTSNPTTPNKSQTAKSNSQKRSKDQQEAFSYEYGKTEDDDEILTPSKRAKVKSEGQENGGFQGQSAPLFKIEDLESRNVINMERDDLYEEHYA